MNRPIWADDQAKVLAAHPTARCVFYGDKFRISLPKGDYLSAPWDTETMAWADAAEKIKKSEAQPLPSLPPAL